MERAKAFQVVARKCGFVEADECGDGTVLWFRKATKDAATGTHQRMCLDSLTNSATVYWTNARGKIDSKTFRSVTAFQEWMTNSALVEPSNNVVLESSSPDAVPPAQELSIAVGVGKRAT